MGELDIPNHHNKTEIDTKTETHATYYDKIAMDSLLANQIYTDSENINITNNQISLTFPKL